MTKKFTKMQPKHGDKIIHCGHMDADRCHFLKYTEPVKFARPDGTFGLASWLVVCDKCWKKAGKKPSHVFVRGDGLWRGDAPAVEEVPESGTIIHDTPPNPEAN